MSAATAKRGIRSNRPVRPTNRRRDSSNARSVGIGGEIITESGDYNNFLDRSIAKYIPPSANPAKTKFLPSPLNWVMSPFVDAYASPIPIITSSIQLGRSPGLNVAILYLSAGINIMLSKVG